MKTTVLFLLCAGVLFADERRPALYVPVRLNPPEWVRVLRVEGEDGRCYVIEERTGLWVEDKKKESKCCRAESKSNTSTHREPTSNWANR